jgi:hypothetical protein
MAAFSDEVRLFDRCGLGNPMLAEYDLEQTARYAPLGLLTHDFSAGQVPTFVIPPSSHFCFLIDELPNRHASVARGSHVLLAVEADYLRGLAQANPVALQETVRLFRPEEPVTSEIHVSVRLFRSGPSRPAVDIDINPTMQLRGEIPADGYLPFGTIRLRAADPLLTESREHADLLARVELRAAEGTLVPVGVLRYRIDDDEKDRGWLASGSDFIDALEPIPAEGRFRTERLDLGVTYEHLRRLARNVPGSSSGRPVRLAAEVRTYLRRADGNLEILKESSRDIEVEGTPSDSVAFSGLCGMAPRRLALRRGMRPTSTFEFPFIRARVDKRRVVTERVQLHIAAHADALSVEIGTALTGEASQLMSALPRCSIGPLGETFDIPLSDLLDEARKQKMELHNLNVRVTVIVNSAAGFLPQSVQFIFASRLVLEKQPPDWLACIDFGTSSTALWIGRGAQAMGHQVGLGDWLSRIDQYHSERPIGSNAQDASPAHVPAFLLPSHIGLSSEINLRADFDPLSLGNLALAYPGREAAAHRIEALNRTYDISVPFPSSVQLPEHLGAIITEPKRKMILRASHISIDAEVIERQGSGQVQFVRRIDLGKVIEDYFDEFGGYTTPSALINDSALANEPIVANIAQARLDPTAGFGLVVTHPCGIDEVRREIYRRAGKRFLHAFCGADIARHDDVILIAEAMAAARYGIEDYQHQQPDRRVRPSPETFVTLDIGAGTYDITAIETASANANHWNVASHFGMAVGGSDLDAALVARVITLLDCARGKLAGGDRFDIHVDAGRPGGPHRHWLERELQVAKGQLTAQLLQADTDAYVWRSRAEGAPPMDILVGRPGGSPSGLPGDGPVTVRGTAEIAQELPGGNATLSFERTASGPAVRLRMWRDAFAAGPVRDNLDTLMEVMGSEIPGLAITDASRLGRPPIVVVTGRAALWPLLHERIERTVAAHAAPGARMSRRKPFRPEEMKHAVVLGAISIAREAPGRDLEASLENPIAMIAFEIDFNSRGATGAGRVARNVTTLIDDAKADKTEAKSVVIDGPFMIARIIPGLDRAEGQERRLRLFQELYRITRIKPFVELTQELAHPLPGERNSSVEWKVSCHRDLSGVRLTFDCGRPPPIEFGPFGGGRVYGPE